METDLVAYYRRRAASYDELYHIPERQKDLADSSAQLKNIFSGKDVLEICCGTGYWTEQIAATAKHVLATDINEAMLDIARQRLAVFPNVDLAIADIFSFSPERKYEALFGGFIWSHIPKSDLQDFLRRMSSHVVPGGLVVFMDNLFVEGSSTPIAFRDENGDDYQHRTLKDGSQHIVRKNFPTETEVRQAFHDIAAEMNYDTFGHYWIAVCRTKL